MFILSVGKIPYLRCFALYVSLRNSDFMDNVIFLHNGHRGKRCNRYRDSDSVLDFLSQGPPRDGGCLVAVPSKDEVGYF